METHMTSVSSIAVLDDVKIFDIPKSTQLAINDGAWGGSEASLLCAC